MTAVPPSGEPPVAMPQPTATRLHGRERHDAYGWLSERDSTEVRSYLDAENAYTETRTAHLADLRDRLFQEISDRTEHTDLSVPARSRGFWYYGRSFEGREYGASCRVPVASSDDWTPPQLTQGLSPDQPALPGEQVLLDLDELAVGHDFFSLGGASVSPDAGLLAYSTDTTGDERYTVRVKDLSTGELLPDVLTDVVGGAIWSADNEALYYTTVDASWRPDKVWRHTLGTAQETDELVHHEVDERFFTGVGRTRTDRFVFVVSSSKTTSEYRVLDAEDPEAGFWVFSARRDGVEYHLEHAVIAGEDVLLVLHNATGPDFELGTAGTEATPPERWQALLPHDPQVRLEDVDAFATHLVVQQRSLGLTQLRILPLAAEGVADDYLVEFDRPLYTIGGAGTPSFDSPSVRLAYTSLALPPSVYDYDVRTRELLLRKQTPVRGGFDPDDYEEHRLWATSDDGATVPISLVVRRGRADGHPVPLLLYGYGAYEISMDPYFSIARLSLLDRGAAFAIAHVRGGGEMGRRWYDEGKLGAKQNTFSDFIACARHLIASGWTTPEHLIAEGGSAGGLLVGAALNQAPEVFGGAVTSVPFVDSLTSMLDPSLPLTVTEYEEWGNPTADPEAYAAMAAYAPYDNVIAQDYPPILAETSLHDTRVLFTEPAKWIARLRATATGRRDFLLRTEMAAGHGGVSGRYQSWKDRAFSLAWILDRMGLAETPPAGPPLKSP